MLLQAQLCTFLIVSVDITDEVNEHIGRSLESKDPPFHAHAAGTGEERYLPLLLFLTKIECHPLNPVL